MRDSVDAGYPVGVRHTVDLVAHMDELLMESGDDELGGIVLVHALRITPHQHLRNACGGAQEKD